VRRAYFLQVPNGGYNNPMTEGDAFLRAICEEPDEDTSRLAYADWLDEHGDHDRAEFIRVQCELALLPANADGRRLEVRANELLGRHMWEWVGDLRDLVREHRFVRGFVEEAEVDADVFLNCPDNIFRQAPLRKVFIRTTLELLPAVTASPDLSRFRTLRLGLDLGDHGADIIAHSPLLMGVRELDLGNNALSPIGIETLAESSYLTELTTLGLADNRLGLWNLTGSFFHLNHFPNLGVLDLSRNEIGVEGVLALARSPAVLGLRTLMLSGNPLGSNGAWPLTTTTLLSEHGVLSDLDLTGCELGDAGAVDMAWAQWGGRLQSLNLAYNDIRMEGAKALAESPFLTSLKELNLVGNPLTAECSSVLRGRFGDKVLL